MNTLIRTILAFILLTAFMSACNLEQEVDIDLPAYSSRPVVEVYLEPGKPFRALITRSDAYFADFPGLDEFPGGLLYDSAEVMIMHQGETYTLTNQLIFDPIAGKLYNYAASATVPDRIGEPFELLVRFPDGTDARAETALLPVVPIDSVVIEFPEDAEAGDTLARALTYFTDIPGQTNYYRRMLHFGSLDSLEQDFIADDQIVDDSLIVFGTGYDYAVGDTVINTLYHITETYATFLESLNAAVSANGNPFGQPSPVISNLEGSANAIGIFTGLTYDRRLDIVEK